MSPKGRRTNNRQKRKRIPPNSAAEPRGNQAGGLGQGAGRGHYLLMSLFQRALNVQARRRGKVSPIVRAGLITDEEHRTGVLDETATFFDKLRDKVRRRDR